MYKGIERSPILFYKAKSNPKLKDNNNVKPNTCIWSVCLILQCGNHGENVDGSSLQSPLTRAPPYQKFWEHHCLKLHLLHHRTASSLVCTPWTPSFTQSFSCAWKPQTIQGKLGWPTIDFCQTIFRKMPTHLNLHNNQPRSNPIPQLPFLKDTLLKTYHWLHKGE